MTAADNFFWTFEQAVSYYQFTLENYIDFRDRGVLLGQWLRRHKRTATDRSIWNGHICLVRISTNENYHTAIVLVLSRIMRKRDCSL